jgi:hypothetical protein
MGLLTNIFVASAKDPPDPEEEPESAPGDGIQLKSITGLNLSMLWAIIDAGPWSADRMDEFESLSGVEDGPWLERCPIGLVESLRAAERSDLDRIGREWAATEEMAGWAAADARSLVEELISLARRADTPGRALYIWTCL